MLSQCPKCSLSKSTGPISSVLPQCQCDWKLPTAQPQQETDAWHEIVLNQKQFLDKMELLLAKTATPSQRTWVGLTEQQLNDIENDFWVVISLSLIHISEPTRQP
jgi:hypothetical protein